MAIVKKTMTLFWISVISDFIFCADGYGILIRNQADIDAEGIFPPDSLIPHESELPESFSWRSIPEAGSLLTPAGNQHIPQYCGACYAFGSLHTLQDRIKVARYLMNFQTRLSPQLNLAPDYIASVQVLLNCIDKACSGGSVAGAWEFVRDFQGGGIPTETCMRYDATDTATCEPINICRNCMGSQKFTDAIPDYTCWEVPSNESKTVPCFGDKECKVEPYPRLGVDLFGKIPAYDEGAIRREIAARGPVACAVDAHPMLSSGASSPILEDTYELHLEKTIPHARLNSKNGTDHIIEIVGWGIDHDSNIPFWEIRNSWGEYWGDGGFLKVRRGRNDLLIESDCQWVIPSGWGAPSVNWQDYDEKLVNQAARDLIKTIKVTSDLSSDISSDLSPVMESSIGSNIVEPSPSSSSFNVSSLFINLLIFACAGSLFNTLYVAFKPPNDNKSSLEIEMNSTPTASYKHSYTNL